MAKKLKRKVVRKESGWMHVEEEIIIAGGGLIIIVMVVLYLF